MRIVYCGTPEFAVPSLEALIEAKHDLVAVVTRPDAIRSRGKTPVATPVKMAAMARGLPVIEASRIDAALTERIRACAPDLLVVVAYGCIIPDEVLSVPSLECINVHASLLPRWRGAAPVQRAVLAGDEYAGVSIMRVVHELDAGAYCRQASVKIGDKSSSELLVELADLGARELVAAVRELAEGTATWTEQDTELVTYASKLTKVEMYLKPEESAEANLRRIRAQTSNAPARCVIGGKGVRISKACICGARTSGAHTDGAHTDGAHTDGARTDGARTDGASSVEGNIPSGTAHLKKTKVVLDCKTGALELISVRPDGKQEMRAADWGRGFHSDRLVWTSPASCG